MRKVSQSFATTVTHLDSGFRQIDISRNLLPRVNIRIMRLLKGSLEFLELCRRKGRSYPTLFPLFRKSIVTRVRLVAEPSWNNQRDRMYYTPAPSARVIALQTRRFDTRASSGKSRKYRIGFSEPMRINKSVAVYWEKGGRRRIF